MINKNNNTLHIFDNFEIDTSLPKYKEMMDKRNKQKGSGIGGLNVSRDFSSSDMDMDGMADMGVTPMSVGGSSFFPRNESFNIFGSFPNAGIENQDEAYWDGISYSVRNEWERQQLMNYQYVQSYYRNGGRKQKLLGKFYLWAFGKKFKSNPTRTIESFFVSIKNSKEELQKIDERLDSFKKALLSAKESGQKALEEKLISQIAITGLESQLYAVGYTKVITEEQVVKFVKETKRGLRMDWIKNFTRLIPDEILQKKKALDENKIFDAYVILHFDVDNKANAKTKEDIKKEEKKKDPILFGLIRGSRKLYFVADWIDEMCDLQFKDLVKVLGEKEVKQNDISSEINIHQN